MKKTFIIGGMSESGKSTLGRYLDSKGVVRLKIVSFLKNIMEREGFTGDFYEWNDRNVAERPEWVREEFTKEFVRYINKEKIEYCCLESLYGPELGVYMRDTLGSDKIVIVYVDIPLDVRLQRQVIRENLSSLEKAKDILLPRDEKKIAWRVPEIKTVSDVVINNSRTIKSLYYMADKMLLKYCPELTKLK